MGSIKLNTVAMDKTCCMDHLAWMWLYSVSYLYNATPTWWVYNKHFVFFSVTHRSRWSIQTHWWNKTNWSSSLSRNSCGVGLSCWWHGTHCKPILTTRMIVERKVINVWATYFCHCLALSEQQSCALYVPMCMSSSIYNPCQSTTDKRRKPPKIYCLE